MDFFSFHSYISKHEKAKRKCEFSALWAPCKLAVRVMFNTHFLLESDRLYD